MSLRPASLSVSGAISLTASPKPRNLTPGSRLKFPDLQTRHGTSVGVMREALVRMAEQGLVGSEPQVGSTGATLSVNDLTDLTAARTTIECLVFGPAI